MKRLVATAAFAIIASSGLNAARAGEFFIDGGMGRSTYSLAGGKGYNDKTDWASSIRAGYMWHGFVDYGLEAGYADLGQAVDRYDYIHITGSDYLRDSTTAKGWLLGGRLEYRLGQSWYLMMRGGWFHPDITRETGDWVLTRGGPRAPIPASGYTHYEESFSTGGQTYCGLGVGYLISAHWRVGLNFDYYDLGSLYTSPSYNEPSSHAKFYSASVQYRF